MSSSIHDKLGRVRPPRLHIRYDVETDGAVVLRELPFVVGIMGDFSGNPAKPLDPLEKRKFISIDRDNLNEVMARMAPALNFRVENSLAGDGSELAVQLKFNSMEDFEPAKIVEQIEPLRKLLETRNKLRDLLTTVDKAQSLEPEIEELLKNTERMQALAGELGTKAVSSKDDKGGDQ